jgi:hypothetical protein
MSRLVVSTTCYNLDLPEHLRQLLSEFSLKDQTYT